MKNKVIVIGGGQAGLAVGYYLRKSNIPFQIIDASPHIGDAWRNRWDSLRLFTSARYVGLPGLPFPARGDAFPTKDEMADYLQSYADYFNLPVQTGVKVRRLSKPGESFIVETNKKQFEADQVVVAMGNYQVPKTPSFARDLNPDITQLHSHHYRNSSQLQDGEVLIVGVGNSGADIALDVARTHSTWIAGKEPGVVPFPIDGFMGRFLLSRVVRFIFHHVLTADSPIGRRKRPEMLSHTAPLVRVKPKYLVKAGVKRVPRIVGVRDGWPLMEDGLTLKVKSIIWCTGYGAGFSWIDLPIFEGNGQPKHERGVVTGMPGMYFVGLHFLYAMSSGTLMGVGRDAEHVAGHIKQYAQTSTNEEKEHICAAVA